MSTKAMRVDSMANEAKRSVRQAVDEVRAGYKVIHRNTRDRNGDAIPLFAWLRSARVYAKGSPVFHLTQDTEPRPKLAVLISRTEAAAIVVRRLNRRNPMTATQLRLLHTAITARYGGDRCRRPDLEWVNESPFRNLYDLPKGRGQRMGSLCLERDLLELDRGFHPFLPEAPAVLTSKRLTDALLMAHLYATIKPGVAERI